MRYTKIAVLSAAGALSVASAITPADARHAKHVGNSGWTVGVLRAGSGYYYGPQYGYPTHPSFWYGPTSGVYAFNPGSVCYAPRAYPSYFWNWRWWLEDVC
jgi:hypothetical protein